MHSYEALEAYLIQTDQIHPLAKRQAQVLCRSVADPLRQTQARMLLLLNLAALHKGAPRAPKGFLLEPLNPHAVTRHISAFTAEHPGESPVWKEIITGAAFLNEITAIIDTAFGSPDYFAPLTGSDPQCGDSPAPLLVVGGGQAGFSRYWVAAVSLEKHLSRRLQRTALVPPVTDAAGVLGAVFTSGGAYGKGYAFHYRQAAAAALSLRVRFMIVSGGPGTGKTSVAVQILRTLLRAFDDIEPERIVLCAPTGRAKARLGESIAQGIDALALSVTGLPVLSAREKALKGVECKTIHSLLGVRPDGSMKYNRANPLPHQVILVDEASMVDLCLFSAFMDAVSADCRIILLGDMHQLPSVEAGAVLGDLTECFTAMDGFPTLTPDCAGWVHAALKDSTSASPAADAASLVLSEAHTPQTAVLLADHVIVLTRSYRSTGAITDLAMQVNRGDAAAALQAIRSPGNESVVSLIEDSGIEPVGDWLRAYWTEEKSAAVGALKGVDPGVLNDTAHADHERTVALFREVFSFADGARILTLAHDGVRGRIAVNNLGERLLRPRFDKNNTNLFYHGQQVILNRNLHDLDLYNGDTGIVIRTGSNAQAVVFRRRDSFLSVATDRLTGVEPAFAITVHKSQGSEFDSVLLVLPQYDTPLLTRQIIYTGITRAKGRICILGSRGLLEKGIQNRQDRPGGIFFG